MSTLDHEETLRHILERNARVELNKAWETSWTRRLTIFILTYVIGCILLWSLGAPLFAVQALLPALGYILSTFSLPWVKRVWMAKYSR